MPPMVAAAVLLFLLPGLAGGQGLPGPPAAAERRTVGNGVDGSEYEARYGTPVYWSLESIVSGEDLPRPDQAIETRGRLRVRPQRQALPEVGLCVESRALDNCIFLTGPSPEIHDPFWADVPFRTNEEATVVGLLRGKGMFFWSFTSGPPKERLAGKGGRTLEELVRGPERFAGRTVTVRGHFRGRNLYDDLPAESRRSASDWVLRDGPFSAWVTRKAAAGRGWRLEMDSRADGSWLVEVEADVEARDGYVYLKAREVRLVHRDGEARR